MNALSVLLNVRKQVEQARVDAATELLQSQSRRDRRAMDHFGGKVLAFRAILDILDIDIEEADVAGRRSREREQRGWRGRD